jgi:hypothetical protein
VAFEIHKEVDAVLKHIKAMWTDAAAVLMAGYYDPTAMMEGVLEDLYKRKELSFVAASHGSPGHLARGEGPCVFCDNTHWKFPQGCPYGKPQEKPLPTGFLDKVAAAVIAAGSPPAAHAAAARMYDDGFEARRAAPSALDLRQSPAK